MTNIDLYTANYLGESETTLIEKNSNEEIVFMVRVFSADFNSIVDSIQYDENLITKVWFTYLIQIWIGEMILTKYSDLKNFMIN